MRGYLGLGLSAAAMLLAGGAAAAPNLQIRHAIVRVTLIPEARGDIVVSVVKANQKLPLSITRVGDTVTVDGGLGWRSPNCHGTAGKPSAGALGVGEVRYEDMPQILVRTPRNVSIGSDGAVFGAIAAGESVDLANTGCGDWNLADQAGALRLRVTGSGDVHSASVGSADVQVAGSGDVTLRAVRNGMSASVGGSGNVTADSVSGPLHAHVGGSGDVTVRSGVVTDMVAFVGGSGDVVFKGVAGSLKASVAGSGDVTVARVTGAVTKSVAGSGDVTVGH